jgi:hypothetical protein
VLPIVIFLRLGRLAFLLAATAPLWDSVQFGRGNRRKSNAYGKPRRGERRDAIDPPTERIALPPSRPMGTASMRRGLPKLYSDGRCTGPQRTSRTRASLASPLSTNGAAAAAQDCDPAEAGSQILRLRRADPEERRARAMGFLAYVALPTAGWPETGVLCHPAPCGPPRVGTSDGYTSLP